MAQKHVLVIGAGVAGLSAACDLADLGVGVTLVEQSPFAGGHAVQYTCKAAEQCVKCGACMVEERLEKALQSPGITLMPNTQVNQASRGDRFLMSLLQEPTYIDPERCDNCGICLSKCPVEGAVLTGWSGQHKPFYAISPEKCSYLLDGSCGLCRDACPQKAIDLDDKAATADLKADAVIMATGFTPFSPESKPYGYGRFANVITNLEMERMLRRRGEVLRPSDGAKADKIAFIQCVGSRDSRLNHLWCSKVCCGSALRMANLINARRPEAEITFFYIDVQTFGRDFDTFFPHIRQQVRMVRAIPADIYPAEADALKVTYLDPQSGKSEQAGFDLVVLSVGLLPKRGAAELAAQLGAPLAETGFMDQRAPATARAHDGIFTAGSAAGPMSIAESIASAGLAAGQVARYLEL